MGMLKGTFQLLKEIQIQLVNTKCHRIIIMWACVCIILHNLIIHIEGDNFNEKWRESLVNIRRDHNHANGDTDEEEDPPHPKSPDTASGCRSPIPIVVHHQCTCIVSFESIWSHFGGTLHVLLLLGHPTYPCFILFATWHLSLPVFISANLGVGSHPSHYWHVVLGK